MSPRKKKDGQAAKKPAGKAALKILVIHGPNLNFLGTRETSIYGRTTLEQINAALKKEASVLKVSLEIVQFNHEGKIVDLIGRAPRSFDGILINPAAYTHTSAAIRNALLAAALPAVEVHLSNIYKREEFRQHSLTALACQGQIAGFGMESYLLGLKGLISSLRLQK